MYKQLIHLKEEIIPWLIIHGLKALVIIIGAYIR